MRSSLGWNARFSALRLGALERVALAVIVIIWGAIFLQTVAFPLVHGSGLDLVSTGKTGQSYPITWLSRVVDFHVFGDWAGGPHLINALLHLINTLLVAWLFMSLTGHRLITGTVATLFLVHPLQVESVVWVSGRAQLLGALFYLLTLISYSLWIRRSQASLYWASVASAFVGFLTSSSLVTVPLALLLIDFWPYHRLTVQKSGLQRLLEKWPFFAMALAFVVVAHLMNPANETAAMTSTRTLTEQLSVGSLAYGAYLLRTLWPTGLAAFYPQPTTLQPFVLALITSGFFGISILALISYKRASYLLFGWCWFFLLLIVPASGLVSIPSSFSPDSATYLALIGPFAALACALFPRDPRLAAEPVPSPAVDQGCRRERSIPERADSEVPPPSPKVKKQTTRRVRRKGKRKKARVAAQAKTAHGEAPPSPSVQTKLSVMVAASRVGVRLVAKPRTTSRWPGCYAAAAILVLSVLCFRQVRHWQDEPTLWRHTLAVTGEHNYFAHNKLAEALLAEGEREQAVRHLEASIAAKADFSPALLNLGEICIADGHPDKVIVPLEQALIITPEDSSLQRLLAEALEHAGHGESALAYYERRLFRRPDDVSTRIILGDCLHQAGRDDDALAQFENAAVWAPEDVLVRGKLGAFLVTAGRYGESLPHLEKAANSDQVDLAGRAAYDLARSLRSLGHDDEARRYFKQAADNNAHESGADEAFASFEDELDQ